MQEWHKAVRGLGDGPMKKLIKIWLLLMLAGVFTAGCVYVAFQQTQRQGANLPAAQLAKQTVYLLTSQPQASADPELALPTSTDANKTITPFVLIYDNNQQLVATSNVGQQFSYPQSCLDQIASRGEYRVTWQPQDGFRFATVGIKYQNGYVVGVYSLAESEATTAMFAVTLTIGCLLYAAGTALLLLIYGLIRRRFKTTSVAAAPVASSTSAAELDSSRPVA